MSKQPKAERRKQRRDRLVSSLWLDAFRRLKRNKASVISACFIFVMSIIAIFASEIAPYHFAEQHTDRILQSPSFQHLLGTDNLGRDLLSRLIYGARMSMAIAVFTALVSILIGALYGAISGWFGGKVDAFMMRAMDTLYSIPALVLLILVMVIFNSIEIFEHPELKAMMGIFFALSIVGWVSVARLVRGQVLQVKEMLYVEAAYAMGAKGTRILIKHILPNIIGPIIITLTFQIPSNVLFESFLSFIGLGLQPPYSSWGVLANEGWRSLRTYPHLIISPSIAIFLTMLSFNLFGDGLRDAVDPKLK